MSDYEAYIEDQEGRLKELEGKIDLVTTRVGMTEDAEERVMVRELMVQLSDRMKFYVKTVEDLRDAGSVWEDMKDSVEKAYMNVKDSLRKISGGLIK